MTDDPSSVERGASTACWLLLRAGDAGLVLLGVLWLGPCLLGGGMDACRLLNLAGPGHLFPAFVAASVLGRAGRYGVASPEASEE